MSGALDDVEQLLDLATTPFTLPGSRLLVLDADAAGLRTGGERDPAELRPGGERDAAERDVGERDATEHAGECDAGERDASAGPVRALAVCTAEYERPVGDCVVVRRLVIRDGAGQELPVTRVTADRIEMGHVTLTFAGPGAISLGTTAPLPWSAVLDLPSVPDQPSVPDPPSVPDQPSVPDPPAVPDLPAAPAGVGWASGLPSAPRTGLYAHGVTVAVREAGLDLRSDGGGWVELSTDGPVTGDQRAHLEATRATWQEWMSRCPRVRPDLAPMTALCWWVLGANQVTLHGHEDARAVVPSLLGYVGLWQWDAYFIAAGLRHGAPELARHQIDLALRYPGPDGQLPDVVHDGGVLASSADLPPADLESLRRKGSGAADAEAVVALTKPPLTAWAVQKVAEVLGDEGWASATYGVVGRAQDWWFACSDTDGDGMPEYGHPYSSGLDDSPVFDAAPPVVSPDLGAYLVLQDELLARHADHEGDGAAAAAHRDRAGATLALLLDLWDAGRGYFAARSGGHPVPSHAVVSLLPLLTGRLPARLADRLRDALRDPHLFAAPWGVPTVARTDPTFDPDAMWRGPTWLNMCALLVEGLAASGFAGDAEALAERALAGVVRAGGPHEYLNPLTGRRASGATTSFGWTAALFVDLAVRLSHR